MLGIDFAGGDNLTLSFSQKVEPDKLREKAIAKMGIQDPQIQFQRTRSEMPRPSGLPRLTGRVKASAPT